MGKKGKKGKPGFKTTMSSGSGGSPPKRTFSGSFGGPGTNERPVKKKKFNHPHPAKAHDGREAGPPLGYDSAQTRSSSASGGSNANTPVKKPDWADFPSNQNQRGMLSSIANAGPGIQIQRTAAPNVKKPSTSDQAKSQLTAAQVFKKPNTAAATASIKQEKTNPTTSNKTGVTAANESNKQGKMESKHGKKKATLNNETGVNKQEKIECPPTKAEKKLHVTTSPHLNEQGKTELPTTRTEKKPKDALSAAANKPNKVEATSNKAGVLSKEAAALPSKAADIFTTKTIVDTFSNMKAKVKSVVLPRAKPEESETSNSESGSDSQSSESDDSDDDHSEDGSNWSQPVRQEVPDSSGEDEEVDNEEEKSAVLPKARAIGGENTGFIELDTLSSENGSGEDDYVKSPTTNAEIKTVETVPSPHPKIENVDTSSSESGYESDNDDVHPTFKAESKAISLPQPKIEETDSSSSGSGSNSEDDDEEQPAPSLEARIVASPLPRVEEIGSSSSESGSDSSEEEGGSDDDREEVATSSKDSSAKRVLDVTSQGPTTRQLTPHSDLIRHPQSTSEPFNGKFREILMGPEFNLSSSDVDELANKLRSKNVHVNFSSNSIEQAGDEHFPPDKELVNPTTALPRWFSQKVRSILESPECPEYLAPKDINRLTHYRAWLEGVRHRRWQDYTLADEKRTQLTSLLLQYKAEGKNMAAYKHRFLQRAHWKKAAFRRFQRLRKLVEGIKLLDQTLDQVYAHAGMESMKWLSIQKKANRCSGAPCL